MRKIGTVLIGVASAAALLTITACKELFADIEEDFSYWSSEPVITNFRAASPVQTSAAGVQCAPSASDAVFTLTVRNPKNFTFIMPGTPGSPSDIVTFGSGIHDASGTKAPEAGVDYTLTQSGQNTLTLTYKPAFLERYEYGNGNIGAAIKLYSTDGRKFNQIYKFDLYANTAPVLEYAGIGKTTVGTDDYYVLLFRVKDMDATVTTGVPPAVQLRHKDIKKMIVTAGGVLSEIPLSFNTGKTDFTTGGDLLAAVQKLKPTDPELPTGNWLLRLKTDVKVGGPEKVYEVCIKDEQGLSSAVIPARTKKTKLADVKLFDGSTEITGTSDSNLKECAGMSIKTLTAQAAPAGTTITGSIAKFDGSTWTQISGGTVSGTTTAAINLPALGTGIYEERYKITLKAQLSGYDDSDPKEFFIKLVRYEVPVLKLKQDFSSGDNNLHCISAGTKAYVTEDIIPDAGQYNSSNPLLIYTASSSNFKLELSASAGTAVKYKLDGGSEQSAPAPAEITVTGGTHKLEVWAVKDGIEGPHTPVHIKGIGTLNTYSELKNVVKNAPENGTGPGQYDYSNNIDIKIVGNLNASSADTEIAVTGGKDLMLSGSPFGTVRTVNAGGLGRILKISDSDTELTLSNIELTGGYAADGKGGAVCVETGCSLWLYGKTVIIPSTGGDTNTPGKNDVYLADGAKIKLDDALQSPEPIVARITPKHYNDGDEVLGGGSIGSGTPPNYTKFSVTQTDDGFLWKIKSDGTLKAIPTTINSGSGAWKKLKDAVQALPEGSTITINGEINATAGSGSNANNGVIDITKNITIQGKIGANSDMLNANRDNLGSNAHPVFRVSGGKTLTLKNLTLKGGKGISGTFGGAINVTGGSSTAELEGCTIEDCQAEDGGAIGCSTGTTVKLKNTTIKKCKTTGSGSASGGGAIFASGATVEMTGCTLTGNEAKSGGAIYAQKHTSFPNTPSNVTVSGGTIGGTGTNDANNATEVGTDGGGGIYIGEACKLTLKDSAEVIGNTAIYNGAGIYTKGELTMESCTITDNKTTGASTNTGGGGVYVESGSVEIKDATKIYHNYTDASGGGIYVNDGTVTLKNATIGGEQLYDGIDPGKTKGNKAQYCGGIYIKNGTITMENCTLSNNNARDVGGIWADNGNLTVKGCTLTNNEAATYGGGIYVGGGTFTMENCTLTGNKAKNGGAIYIDKTCTLTMQNNVQLIGNKAGESGGGIYAKGATVNITNCTLKGNTAKRGGAIFAIKEDFTVTAVTIKGNAIIGGTDTNDANKATGDGTYEGGGGIWLGQTCTLVLEDDVQITGNAATKKGVGIHAENTIVMIKDRAKVDPNNDVYLASGSMIRADSTLTPPGGTAAKITVPDDKYQPTTQVLLAGTGVTLESETYKFAVTPQTSPAPQEWTVGGNGCLKQGRYTEVPYDDLETYLANASENEVNYIEVTGISATDLTGSYASPPNPGALGQKIKNKSSKKVALKLPSGLSVADMSYCFSQCENLISLENFPSDVTDMRACFYKCENLTTVPAIPASVTDIQECFRYCKKLTTGPDIPSGVFNMTSCFQGCEKLERVKLNCNYNSFNFGSAFRYCDALEDNGIRVPSSQLGTYKANATAMGTTPAKFSGF